MTEAKKHETSYHTFGEKCALKEEVITVERVIKVERCFIVCRKREWVPTIQNAIPLLGTVGVVDDGPYSSG